MQMNEYQASAMRTLSDKSANTVGGQLTTACLGLAGETGEFCEHVKKYLYHGHPLDYKELEKEVGDILWYVALAARAIGCSLNYIANENIDKLRIRYPEKFSTERSLYRDEK